MSDFNWDDHPVVDPSTSSFNWDDHPIADALPPKQGFMEQAGRSLVNSLPTLGGVAGGILGTPADAITGPMGTVAGAGIGGYLGTSAKNLINHYIDPQNAPQTTQQAALDPFVGGTEQAAMAGAGEIAGPLLAGPAKKVGGLLNNISDKLTLNSTGATALQTIKKFPKNAAQFLKERGLVGFGDTQASIAKKSADYLEKSGQNIGDALTALDSKGGQVNQSQIIDSLRQRAKSIFENEPENLDVVNGLNKMADQLEERSAQLGSKADQSLSAAEKSKRGFQSKVNYDAPNLDNSVNSEAASAYQNTVEKNATAVDPDIANNFKVAKEDYAALSPIEEATERRAAINAQRQGVNFHGIGKGALGAALGGEEGYRHGGVAGGILGATAGALVAPRLSSSSAIGADWLGNLIKSAPQSLGKWAPILSAASSRGGNSLPATDYVLQQTDPDYRDHVRGLKNTQEQIDQNSDKYAKTDEE